MARERKRLGRYLYKTLSEWKVFSDNIKFFRGVAQLVARMVRDHEVVGSNPVASTKRNTGTLNRFLCFLFTNKRPINIYAKKIKKIKKRRKNS